MEEIGEIFLLSDKNHVLDKAFELFRICYKQNDWMEAKRISAHMRVVAENQYKSQQKWGDISHLQLPLKRPLIFYIGYSHLAESIVYQKQGLYNEAKSSIEHYATLEQYDVSDEEGQEEIRRFKTFAKANSYAVDLLSGNFEVLEKYHQFIQSDDEEILPGLITILEAANQNNWNIDHVLKTHIPHELETFASYEDIGNRVYYIKLLNQLAIYSLNKKSYQDTINYILDYLSIAVNMDVYREIITVTAMYEKVRKLATTEQQLRYENIIKGVLTNEKSIDGFVLNTSAL
ncbi:DNA-binding protein [Paenibacillus peoriae]|uniref:DNA-binding protein n=1 Tax=Paenibacillus peoriae TaxID=59893 RepID=UPI001CC1FBD3|nr:DNA-binding protein [Paenibacillus peoriae]